jgi:predicted phage tail protein
MPQNETKSIGELLNDLGRESSTLIRQEIQLAKTELTEKAVAAGKGAALFIVAGVLAFFAVQVFLAAAVLGLALVLPAWGAALVVGGVVLLLAAIVALVAGSSVKKAKGPVAQQTVDTLKEDVRWAKQQLTT